MNPTTVIVFCVIFTAMMTIFTLFQMGRIEDKLDARERRESRDRLRHP